MGDSNEEERDTFTSASASLTAPSRLTTGPPRPTIALPSRTSMESLLSGGGGGGFGFSPGPMTLVSSFFSDNDDCKSFSQLLAGAMASPVSFPSNRDGGEGGGFKQNRPPSLTIAQSPAVFTIPPGLSPTGLLDSPAGLFSPDQGPFGMTHQQALAQVTALATQAPPQMHIQADYSSSISAAPANSLIQAPTFNLSASIHQQMPPLVPDSGAATKGSPDFSQSEQKVHQSTIDKPGDDGFNWRKYGQKHVKGSEFPRSYYKCTHPNCPVKKKVECSLDGQITAIIYKGQHNHQRPQPNKRTRDSGSLNEDIAAQIQSGSLKKLKEGLYGYPTSKKDQESNQATPEQFSSDSEEVGDAEAGADEKDEEPEPERRDAEVRALDPASSHRTVTEPRIIVQTTSEVDLLDDGYRWRKYGQKVVKGNPYPRSYYKCTTLGCNVRKHVERASTDPKAVITTYEGKHNHDVPAAKSSSHNTANSSSSQLRPHNTATAKHVFHNRDLGNNLRQPVARLRLKEEQIT